MQKPLELEDESAYSEVCPTAIIALILGAASPLAFIGPLFFLVPAAAIGVALIALGKIRRSGGALAGDTLARIAVALALACIAAAMVRGSVRDSLMQGQAADTAQRWFSMLADGQINDALELLTGDARNMLAPPPSMGEEPMPEEDAKAIAFDRMRSDLLTRALNNGAEVALETVAGPEFDGMKAVVSTTFMLGDPNTGEHRHVQVQMIRLPYYEQQGDPWRIDRWTSGEAHGAH